MSKKIAVFLALTLLGACSRDPADGSDGSDASAGSSDASGGAPDGGGSMHDADIPESDFVDDCRTACESDEDAQDCTAGQLDSCAALCAEATTGLGSACGGCMVGETGVLVVDCEPDVPALFECPGACEGDGLDPASFVLRCRDACENNDWAATCSGADVEQCVTECLEATSGRTQRCGSCITNFTSLVEGCVTDIPDADLCSGSCENG